MDTTITNTVDNMPSALEKARLLYELGRYEELLKLLMPQLDSLDEPDAGYSLCVSALQGLKRHEESLQLVEQGLSRHPESAQLLISYASVLGFCGRYEKALEQAEAVLATDPDNPAAYHHRSFCLFKLRRTKEAKTAAEATLALAPDTADTLVLLAWIEHQLDNKQRFSELLDRAMQINPRHAEALALKAYAANSLWNKIRFIRESLAVAPDDPGKQKAYLLFTRQLPRDLAIWLLMIVATGLAGFLRPHPAASWLLEAAYPLTLASGLFMLRYTLYHLGGYLITTTAVFCCVRYWQGIFGLGTIPLGAVLGLVALVALILFRLWIDENLENLRNRWQQARIARRHGNLGRLLIEWFPPHVVLAMLAAAGLPPVPVWHVLQPAATIAICHGQRTSAIPLGRRHLLWAGLWGQLLAGCLDISTTDLFSIVGHQEPYRRPLLLIILYLFALYRAWRQYLRAKQDP